VIDTTTEDNEPLLSIVLTTFNSQAIIGQVLRAIVNQDFPLREVELIIVDGGSKDNTLKIIKEFVEQYAKNFYSVKVIVHNKNYGVSKARNDGMRTSKGRYVLILDHDVSMERNVVRALYEFLSNAPSKVVGAMPLLVPVSNYFLDRWLVKVLEGRITEYYGVADCILLRRDVTEAVGFYDETLGPPFTIFEEREFGARIASKNFKIYILGWIKAYHYTGAEDVQCNDIERKGSSKLFSAIHALLDKRYLYGLKKWIKSMPIFQKIKWFAYSIIAASFIPLILISITIKMSCPIYIWLISAVILYLDVLRQYWNSKIFYISLAYAFIAYIWRLIRSIALIIPTKSLDV
jgi:glycosyltransferase involved in cell wall biosynthesis